MNFFIIVILICLFISLFSLYLLCRDDLILLRRDVGLDKIFNLALLDFIVALIISRAIFAILYSPKMFLNPLVFFLFPYFPGLSLIGGVFGGVIFLILYSRSSGLPTGRILDFFTLSMLSSLPLGYIGYFILTHGKSIQAIIFAVFYVILFFIFIKYLYQYLMKGILRDGSLALIFFFVFSSVSLIAALVSGFNNFLLFKTPENYLYLLLLILSLVIFIRREKLIRTRRR